MLMTPHNQHQPIQNGQLEKLQQKAYLNSKGINPNMPVQLDLVFPLSISVQI